MGCSADIISPSFAGEIFRADVINMSPVHTSSVDRHRAIFSRYAGSSMSLESGALVGLCANGASNG